MPIQSIIIGTGSFVPSNIKYNADFANHDFYDETEKKIELPSAIIAEKFKLITGIEERRYADNDMTASSMAIIAAKRAIADAAIDPETIDQIIFAHNFGDVAQGMLQSEMVPSLASRLKNGLGIKNPNCIPYDLLFGCPGWIQGVLQADAFFKAGIAKRALVVGAETLSRVIDNHDRDSMIFSDGAGASVLEAKNTDDISNTRVGILASLAQSHTAEEINYLYYGKSNLPGADQSVRYLKMKGRKVYEYAMIHVPKAMKTCLDNEGLKLEDVKLFFLHQANQKMDIGFIKELYKLYGENNIPDYIMPMSIEKFGNSSVATIPTLFDMVKHGQLENYALQAGDIIMFAAVGAGMNINTFCYRV